MIRAPLAIDPAADAASVLRRLGFAILMLGVPMVSLLARRAVVVLAPLGIMLLILASLLDGSARAILQNGQRLMRSSGGMAGGLLLFWALLSLLWTPFASEAAERLFNIVVIGAVALGGYLMLPERTRSANLYILPVGLGLSALLALTIALVADGGPLDEPEQNLERGLIVLSLFLWPGVAWLRSRGRHLEALLVAIVVTLATLFSPQPLPTIALVAGALVFAATAASPGLGAQITGGLLGGLVLLAPTLPFVLQPLASLIYGAGDPALASLEVWRAVILEEPVRVITGHGLETALRGRFAGLLSPAAPSTLLFEIWYELGIVGAGAVAVLLGSAVRGAELSHPPLLPGIMAAFATAFAFACLGIGMAQLWWLTALAAVALIFIAVERGQFRTTRPKALLKRP